MKQVTNADRNETAYRTLLVYNQYKNYLDPILDMEELITGLLSDLMHLVGRDYGDNFPELVEKATLHFDEEIQNEKKS